MLRFITLLLAVAGLVSLAIMGSMSLDILRDTDNQAPRWAYASTLLAGDTAYALASRVELSRSLFQIAAIWAGLYMTSIVLCRALIVSGRSITALLTFVLLVILPILLSQAVDMLVVIAYLPALLVLLAMLMRGATDPVA
jgi:hypothetical protein